MTGTPGRLVPVGLGVLALLTAWQVVVATGGVAPRLLPSPARVAQQAWTHRETLAGHTGATLTVTLVGFAVSVVVAGALAVTLDRLPRLRAGVVPLLVASQTVPVLVVAPLLVLWFGFGLAPKVLVVTLVTFFPVALGLVEGFAAAGPGASALLATMGASRRQEFVHVRLPAAMPRFFTALRIAVTYAVVGAVVAEYAGAVQGLGTYMTMQRAAFRTDLVLAAVGVCAALTLVLYALTCGVERLVVPWARPRRVRRG
ncbi:ABC transporter permease [Cellulomonas dongxiuzhuiae]|uniref:ABC transporter permease n=1 Tax=Cellulomonas dongxiuzhuiae TaxID=2819979 RepID=UPI001AAF9A2B|nr:ABC transporter permease [Cellulomonas dongxiuzhuiae]MBO3088093.1 ABC transporter permease [Cellulomonas dongxiuzhuiae]